MHIRQNLIYTKKNWAMHEINIFEEYSSKKKNLRNKTVRIGLQIYLVQQNITLKSIKVQ